MELIKRSTAGSFDPIVKAIYAHFYHFRGREAFLHGPRIYKSVSEGFNLVLGLVAGQG